MKTSNIAMAIGAGMIAGAAVSMIATPKKNKIKATAEKAKKTAGQLVDGISETITSKM